MRSSGEILSINLKKFRQSLNETQAWLAKLLGFSRASINRWETTGYGKTTLDEMDKITEKAGLTRGQLLDFQEEFQPSDQLMTFIKKIQTLKPADQDFLIHTWSRDVIIMANNFADIHKKKRK